MIFHESTGNFDIVSVDLATAAVHPLIATERDEVMPAWAAKQPALVYVTNRNGPPEIWLHNSHGDRPLVTARDFPQQQNPMVHGAGPFARGGPRGVLPRSTGVRRTADFGFPR